ncbi:hypothetical protein GALL_520550 [mine drainage metagenome]|uniref:Uncharacterized protein n=1 Tax=mine drainage metagenome TaxID=410659 RepID=A0A1J5P5A5_9ZZZZ
MSRYSVEVLGKILDGAGVPNAPLLTTDQVAVHPQTRAIEMMARCDGDDIELVGIPLTFDGRRPRARSPAPALGQHNADFRTSATKGTASAK